MATVSINSEQITSIANSLKSKGEQILNQYKGDCASALQMSNQCLQLSGLDTDQIFKSMENVYTKLNDRVAGLADFLINTIAAEYDVLSQSITNSFNNDFANEFGALIGVGVGNGGGTSIGTPIKSPINTELNQNLESIVDDNLSKLPVIRKGENLVAPGLIKNELISIPEKSLEPVSGTEIENRYTLHVEKPYEFISPLKDSTSEEILNLKKRFVSNVD